MIQIGMKLLLESKQVRSFCYFAMIYHYSFVFGVVELNVGWLRIGALQRFMWSFFYTM
jgi:hypothetical protein